MCSVCGLLKSVSPHVHVSQTKGQCKMQTGSPILRKSLSKNFLGNLYAHKATTAKCVPSCLPGSKLTGQVSAKSSQFTAELTYICLLE